MFPEKIKNLKSSARNIMLTRNQNYSSITSKLQQIRYGNELSVCCINSKNFNIIVIFFSFRDGAFHKDFDRKETSKVHYCCIMLRSIA